MGSATNLNSVWLGKTSNFFLSLPSLWLVEFPQNIKYDRNTFFHHITPALTRTNQDGGSKFSCTPEQIHCKTPKAAHHSSWRAVESSMQLVMYTTGQYLCSLKLRITWQQVQITWVSGPPLSRLFIGLMTVRMSYSATLCRLTARQ